MADSSIFRVPKLKGSSNYDMWALRIEAVLIQQDCYEIIIIDLEELEKNKNSESYQKLKNSEIKALSTLRLSLDDGPLLQSKDIKTLYYL